MTLFISDPQYKKKRVQKILFIYISITLFSGIFSWIYEYFSHGVYSNYMVYLFLFPFIGGVLVFVTIGLLKKLPFPSRISLHLYNSGLATLWIGSCLQGVLEIYGTSSNYIAVYWIVGSILIMLGVVSVLVKFTRISIVLYKISSKFNKKC